MFMTMLTCRTLRELFSIPRTHSLLCWTRRLLIIGDHNSNIIQCQSRVMRMRNDCWNENMIKMVSFDSCELWNPWIRIYTYNIVSFNQICSHGKTFKVCLHLPPEQGGSSQKNRHDALRSVLALLKKVLPLKTFKNSKPPYFSKHQHLSFFSLYQGSQTTSPPSFSN